MPLPVSVWLPYIPGKTCGSIISHGLDLSASILFWNVLVNDAATARLIARAASSCDLGDRSADPADMSRDPGEISRDCEVSRDPGEMSADPSEISRDPDEISRDCDWCGSKQLGEVVVLVPSVRSA